MDKQHNTNDLNRNIQDWSRHYDVIQWTVTTILLAAIGGLLAFSFTKYNALAVIAGLILTNLALFFAASFRELRQLLHAQLSGPVRDLLEFRSRRGPPQWKVFCLGAATLDLAWLALLWQHNFPKLALFGLAVISVGLLAWLYHLGRWK